MNNYDSSSRFEEGKAYRVTFVYSTTGNISLEGISGEWWPSRFELVIDSIDDYNTDDLYTLGAKWIEDSKNGKGKIYRNYDNKDMFNPHRVAIKTTVDAFTSLSFVVAEYLKESGKDYCVCLTDGSRIIPMVKLTYKENSKAPEFVEVKLNKSYIAKVYSDKIVVGCQEFSTDIIEELGQARLKTLMVSA